MGGKSKSSNSTTTSNNSGQNAISGDNLGTAISGVNNSTLNVTATDHGAIEAAGNLAELSMTTLGSVSNNALEQMGDVSKGAFELSKDATQKVADFSKDALKQYSASNSENLSMMAGLAGSQAAQNAENLQAVMELGKFKQDNGANEKQKDAESTKKIAIGAAAVVGLAYMVTR